MKKRFLLCFLVVLVLLTVSAYASSPSVTVCPDCGSDLESVFYTSSGTGSSQRRYFHLYCPVCDLWYYQQASLYQAKWLYNSLVLHSGSVTVTRTKEPTCTDVGTLKYSCSSHGTQSSSIPALGHDYTETSYIDPTCITSGSTVSICSRCNDTETEIISALGHDYVETSCTDATCIESGSVVSTCSRCDDVKTETIPALGHDYVVTSHIDPSCTDSGSTVTICSRCDDTETETISALGHDYVETSRTDATCIESGSVVSTCSRCDDIKTEELPVLYHSWDTVDMVPSVYDDEGEVLVQGYIFYSCHSCESQYTAAPGMSPPVSGPISDGVGMQDTTAALGKTLLSGIWALFGITVPGFGFTFGQMWLGVLLCSVSILVIRMIFGFGGGSRGKSPRTSSTNNPRISKERRHDQF